MTKSGTYLKNPPAYRLPLLSSSTCPRVTFQNTCSENRLTKKVNLFICQDENVQNRVGLTIEHLNPNWSFSLSALHQLTERIERHGSFKKKVEVREWIDRSKKCGLFTEWSACKRRFQAIWRDQKFRCTFFLLFSPPPLSNRPSSPLHFHSL